MKLSEMLQEFANATDSERRTKSLSEFGATAKSIDSRMVKPPGASDKKIGKRPAKDSQQDVIREHPSQSGWAALLRKLIRRKD